MDPPLGISQPCPNNLSGVSGHLFLTLINTLMMTKCPLSPKIEYPEDYGSQIQNNEEFDFIVIGAGSAGSVVASKLSEKYKVLVLEAGGIPTSTSEIPGLMFSLQGTEEDWGYQAEPSDNVCLGFKNKRSNWPRGKALGGSSSINAMLYIRGNKQDYDQWAELGNPGWDYDSVIETFRKFENLQVKELKNSKRYGKNGPLVLTKYDSKEIMKNTIREAAEELGYPSVKEEEPMGYFEALMTIDQGVRYNTAKSFLGRMGNRKKLRVVTKAHVTKILVDATTKTTRGVEVKIGEKLFKFFSKKETIVSGGAINSPQILMLSGIGPKKHLEQLGVPVVQDLSVGKNLQDHLIHLGFLFKIDTTAMNWLKAHETIDELYKYFMYRAGGLATISITNLVGFINTKNSSSEYPNLQMHHVINQPQDSYLLPELMRCFAFETEIAESILAANKISPTMFMIPTLLHPKSTGEILLKSTEPLEKPLIYANYLSDKNQEDLETMLEGIRFLEKMLETSAFSKRKPELVEVKIPNCQGLTFKSDEYWKCSLRNVANTVYHPVGTCKMGPKSDKEAVVDSRLRVHGVKNLRVIDASIMPKIISANTNAASIMIGFKGAEMILEDWEQRHGEL